MLIPVTVAGFVKDRDAENGSLLLKLAEEGGARVFSIHIQRSDPVVQEISAALLKSDPTITVKPSLEAQKFIDTLQKNGGQFTDLTIRQVDGYEIDGEDDLADITARLTVRMPYGEKKFIDVLLAQGIVLALYCDAKIYVEQPLFDMMSFDYGDEEAKKQRQADTDDAPLRDAEMLRQHIRSIDVLHIGCYALQQEEKSEIFYDADKVVF